ncbi:hypothetical protein C0J52_01360 [Blattella germanica]|nr:hypothetical protein C0J52_01360 [Blattella germanica]
MKRHMRLVHGVDWGNCCGWGAEEEPLSNTIVTFVAKASNIRFQWPCTEIYIREQQDAQSVMWCSVEHTT